MAAVTKSEDNLRESHAKLHQATTAISNLERDKEKLLDCVQSQSGCHLLCIPLFVSGMPVLACEQRCEQLTVAKQSVEVQAEQHRITVRWVIIVCNVSLDYSSICGRSLRQEVATLQTQLQQTEATATHDKER